MGITDKLTAIADAIRVQSGKTDKLTLAQMPTEIINLQSLNFTVVGGTSAPSSPANNTIWVNTNVAIPGWEFVAATPNWAAPQGWVVFPARTSSNDKTNDFNALKKNGIYIQPVSAYQYVNGGWVKRDAKIYKNGQLVNFWDGEIFDNGDQYEDFTGGWLGVANSGMSVTIGNEIVFAIIKNEARDAAAFTRKKVDLGAYSHIVFYVNATDNSGRLHVGITNANTAYAPSMVASNSTGNNGVQELTVDISGVSGSYYVAAWADTFAASISKVRLLR